MNKSNKLPKVWLSYNEPFLRQFSNENYNDFIENKAVKNFNFLLEKNISNILKNIRKFSGIKWYKKDIPIYLTPNFPTNKSISHPLILIFKKNNTRTLEQIFFILVHELVHINFMADRDKIFHKSREKRIETRGLNLEAIIDFISKLIIQKSIKNWQKYDKIFNQKLNWIKNKEIKRKIKRDMEILEKFWDYNKIDFKSFVKNKKLIDEKLLS